MAYQDHDCALSHLRIDLEFFCAFWYSFSKMLLLESREGYRKTSEELIELCLWESRSAELLLELSSERNALHLL